MARRVAEIRKKLPATPLGRRKDPGPRVEKLQASRTQAQTNAGLVALIDQMIHAYQTLDAAYSAAEKLKANDKKPSIDEAGEALRKVLFAATREEARKALEAVGGVPSAFPKTYADLFTKGQDFVVTLDLLAKAVKAHADAEDAAEEAAKSASTEKSQEKSDTKTSSKKKPATAKRVPPDPTVPEKLTTDIQVFVSACDDLAEDLGATT